MVSRSWILSAVHIKGELNALIDSLSRDLTVPTEWSLDSKSFQWLISLGSAPQIDMATSLNHRLPLYVSPFLDHQAVSVDAMSRLEQVDLNIHLPTSQRSSHGDFFPPSLQRESYSSSSMVAKSVNGVPTQSASPKQLYLREFKTK